MQQQWSIQIRITDPMYGNPLLLFISTLITINNAELAFMVFYNTLVNLKAIQEVIYKAHVLLWFVYGLESPVYPEG